MTDLVSNAHPTRGRMIRLDTLIGLRWLAIAGQMGALLIVWHGLDFEFPVAPCIALVTMSAGVNIWLLLVFGNGFRLDGERASAVLAYDIFQLGGLLYLTGGLANPFSVLLMAPVILAATTLTLRYTVFLGLAAVAVATAIAVWHWPLPWQAGESLTVPSLYSFAVWLALVVTLSFIAAFAFRVAEEGRRLDDALAETERVLAREQHLSQLDGLAAAAAHALGTPLGTIAIVAKELEREVPPGSPFADDVALLRTQTDRCRDILRKLSSLADEPEPHFQRMPFSQLVEEVVEPHRNFGVAIHVELEGSTAEPVGTRDPAILYGLGNLIENAVDFARSQVWIRARWSDDTIELTLTDDGPGFASQVLGRLGEPYITRRGRDAGTGASAGASTGGGLGLGFFIAQTLLRRSGAMMHFANRDLPASGAVIRLIWKRDRFEKAVAA